MASIHEEAESFLFLSFLGLGWHVRRFTNEKLSFLHYLFPLLRWVNLQYTVHLWLQDNDDTRAQLIGAAVSEEKKRKKLL